MSFPSFSTVARIGGVLASLAASGLPAYLEESRKQGAAASSEAGDRPLAEPEAVKADVGKPDYSAHLLSHRS